MANDLFGGLGSLMKGLSGFMPQDDPQVKLLNAQTELQELEGQESDLFAQIGRQAYAADPAAWPEGDKLRLIQANLDAARTKLDQLTQAEQAEKQRQQAEAAALTCPNCDTINPSGTKFCQECGAKLGLAAPSACANCGAVLTPGSRFCGECGSRQGG